MFAWNSSSSLMQVSVCRFFFNLGYKYIKIRFFMPDYTLWKSSFKWNDNCMSKTCCPFLLSSANIKFQILLEWEIFLQIFHFCGWFLCSINFFSFFRCSKFEQPGSRDGCAGPGAQRAGRVRAELLLQHTGQYINREVIVYIAYTRVYCVHCVHFKFIPYSKKIKICIRAVGLDTLE